MRTHGDIVIVEGSEYLCKDIYESDNLSFVRKGGKSFKNGVIWNLDFAMNREMEKKLGHPTPKYFIFYPWYPDHTMDVIRFDIKEPRYLTGYNETRKLYKDELSWIIEVLHDTVEWETYPWHTEEFLKEQGYFNFNMGTVWGQILYNYNEYNRYDELPDEIWDIPDYSLLETED